MNLMLLNFYSTLRDFLKGEEGQDLIEYALIAALIALGATAAMSSVGSQISNVFSSISTDLGNAL
jgi:pilus assembly protein Flp/PilA